MLITWWFKQGLRSQHVCLTIAGLNFVRTAVWWDDGLDFYFWVKTGWLTNLGSQHIIIFLWFVGPTTFFCFFTHSLRQNGLQEWVCLYGLLVGRRFYYGYWTVIGFIFIFLNYLGSLDFGQIAYIYIFSEPIIFCLVTLQQIIYSRFLMLIDRVSLTWLDTWLVLSHLYQEWLTSHCYEK